MARTNNAPRDLGLTLLTTVARTIDFYQIDAGDLPSDTQDGDSEVEQDYC